jgi:flavocytochrome c
MEREAAKGLSRRELIRNSALVGLGTLTAGTLAACTPGNGTEGGTGTDIAKLPDDWDGEYDVIVIGAGGAGLAAALEASAAGSSVLVFEVEITQNMSGTALSGGVVMACGTEAQKAAGFEDTAEEMIKYIDAVSDGLADTELLHLWAQNSGDTLRWLQEQGIEFPDDFLYYSGQEQEYAAAAKPAMRGHRTKNRVGSDITQGLYDKAAAAGVEVRFQTRATALYQDIDGRVVGVASEVGDFKARRAVVLASAGFSRNKDIELEFMPTMVKGKSFGSMHQQGDGILMGARAGAKLSRMWAAQAKTPFIDVPGQGAYFAVGPRGLPLLFLNEQGERVMNETKFYELVYEDIAAQPNGFVWGIWDQAAVDMGPTYVSVPPMSNGMTAEIESGLVLTSGTLEELAPQMKLDPAVVAATVERYNEMVAVGLDTDFGKTKGLDALNNPPWYAAQIWPAICDTAGGLTINTRAQVIDWADEPIPGLYAAGSTTGGWRGKLYAGSGTAVGFAVFTGRIAGQSAAVEEPVVG